MTDDVRDRPLVPLPPQPAGVRWPTDMWPRAAPRPSVGQPLYRLLEEQVVPTYYTRDERDVPVGWVEKMKHALRVAGQRFTARRMLQEYTTQFYVPAMCNNATPDHPPMA